MDPVLPDLPHPTPGCHGPSLSSDPFLPAILPPLILMAILFFSWHSWLLKLNRTSRMKLFCSVTGWEQQSLRASRDLLGFSSQTPVGKVLGKVAACTGKRRQAACQVPGLPSEPSPRNLSRKQTEAAGASAFSFPEREAGAEEDPHTGLGLGMH